MYDSLDEQLAADERRELYEHLDRDQIDADEYEWLQQVDRKLRTAAVPVAAPGTLLASVMNRIAEGLHQPQLSRISGLALALALALVTVAMLPLLIGTLWLLLTAVGSAAALTVVVQAVVNVATLLVAGFGSLVLGAQALLAQHPLAPLLMLTLLPVGLFWVLRARSWNRARVTS